MEGVFLYTNGLSILVNQIKIMLLYGAKGGLNNDY